MRGGDAFVAGADAQRPEGNNVRDGLRCRAGSNNGLLMGAVRLFRDDALHAGLRRRAGLQTAGSGDHAE